MSLFSIFIFRFNSLLSFGLIVAKQCEELMKELKTKGMAINPVDSPDAFKEKVKPLYKEFEGKIGKDVMDAFFAATK